MEEYPTFRKDNITVFTSILSAKNNYLYTKVWDHNTYHKVINNRSLNIENKLNTKEDL